jgi:4-hydroxy-tetrahydrodipicolinate synthase
MQPFDSKTYKGLWAAIPTPWSGSGALDENVLIRNCERLASVRVDGIYTTDSDGEFYAIEFDEFRHLARAFARAREPFSIPAAMGVTWTNTRGIIDRIKAALGNGIPNVHVAFPYFMPLAAPDVDCFFDDLAKAAPDARWIHYAHPSAQPTLTGKDYATIASRHPHQLIGTKLGTTNFQELTEILLHAPNLAHTVVDPTILPGYLLGAVGVCSYWCNTLPRWHRAYVDACAFHNWSAAVPLHKKLLEWELTQISKLRTLNHRHGIIGKLRASLTGFLEDTGITRAPYYPVSETLKTDIQRAFHEFWAPEIARERFDSH